MCSVYLSDIVCFQTRLLDHMQIVCRAESVAVNGMQMPFVDDQKDASMPSTSDFFWHSVPPKKLA